MSFLKLNGIAVPVLLDGVGQDLKEFGSKDRGQGLALVSHRRGTKKEWPIRVKHSDGLTALAWEKLLLGEGHVWSFDSDLYSSKGVHPVVLTGTGPGVYTGDPIYGAASLKMDDGATATVAGVLTGLDAWTIAFWLRSPPFALGLDGDGDVTHLIVRSDGAKWGNGVRNDSLNVASVLATGADDFVITFTGAATDEMRLDDLVLLPFLMPEDWPAQIFVGRSVDGSVPSNMAMPLGEPFGELQRLRAEGELIYAGTKVIEVQAEVEGSDIIKAGLDGEMQPVHVVRARLIEV